MSEALNLKTQDIDSRKMRIFVSEGKGKKDRYTVLPQTSLEMLRKYYKMYKPHHPEGYIFLNREGRTITVERTRIFFRRYRRKAKIDEKYSSGSIPYTALSTGATTRNMRSNIYDLAGNMFEWTLEKSSRSGYPCAPRGSYFGSIGSRIPVSVRGNHIMSYSSSVGRSSCLTLLM